MAAIALSLSQLAAEFGTTRETLRKRLDDGNVRPAGKRGGHPVYRLRDALRAWSTVERSPDAMPLADRARYYDTARRELEYRRDAGELILAADMRAEAARAVKVFAGELDALPDILERDCGLTAAQVQAIEQRLDQARDRIAARLLVDDDDDQASARPSA